MRRAAVLLAAAAVAALTAGRAAAATDPGVGYLFGYPLSATHVVQTGTPIFATGEIVVRFHPDPAGCAQLDHCAFSGTTIYRLTDGDLTVTSYQLHGHRARSIALELGLAGPVSSGDVAYTRVSRALAGQPTTVCADELPAGGLLAAHPMGSRVRFDLAGALPQPRCAGPLPSDLSGALPRLSLAIPTQRGMRVTLSSTRPFAAAGFAGTVSSTLALRLGRSTTTTLSRTGLPPHAHPPDGCGSSSERSPSRPSAGRSRSICAGRPTPTCASCSTAAGWPAR